MKEDQGFFNIYTTIQKFGVSTCKNVLLLFRMHQIDQKWQ